MAKKLWKHTFVLWLPKEEPRGLCRDFASLAEAAGGYGYRLRVEEQTRKQVILDRNAHDDVAALFEEG